MATHADTHMDTQPDTQPDTLSVHSDHSDHSDHLPDDSLFEEDRFTQSSVWNDVPFAYFFAVIALAFFITSTTLVAKHGGEFFRRLPPTSGVPDVRSVIVGIVTLITSLTAAVCIFLYAGRNATRFAGTGLKVTVAVLALATFSAIFIGQFMQCVLFAGLAAAIVFLLKKHEPLVTLAGTILQIVVTVAQEYPQTIIAALVGFFSTAFVLGLLTMAVECAYIAYGVDSNAPTNITWSLIGTVLFLNLCGLYIIDVLKGVMHVTIAGFYGTWYYTDSTFTGMPQNEGFGSCKRALSYSFGSICMSSLVVALFQCFAVAVSLGDRSLGVFGQFSDAILRVCGLAVGYFATYALSFVAIYGAGMIRAATATWRFFKQRGRYALTNDLVIASSLVTYSFAAGIASMAISAATAAIASTPYGTVAMWSFAVALYTTTVLLQTAVAGSSAFFFAVNRDPQVFAEARAFDYADLARCSPTLLDGVHV